MQRVKQHLVPPEPVLVEACEAVDDNGDWQSEDENLYSRHGIIDAKKHQIKKAQF